MTTTIYLQVTLARDTGRFVSREDLANALLEQLDDVYVDDSVYAIEDAQSFDPPKQPRRKAGVPERSD